MHKTFTLLLYCLFTIQSYSQSVPSVTINGLNAGEISKNSLLKLDKLDVNDPFKIISFTMVYYINGSVKELEGYAGNLSKEMKDVIKKSKSGDRLSFEHIRVIGTDGVIYKMSSIPVKLK